MATRYLNQIVRKDLSDSKDDPNHIYLNLSFINNDFQSQAPKPLIWFDNRNTSILENAQEYYVGVCKFHIDTLGLPVFIPSVQIGQSDPNLTVYSFTMTYKTHVYQCYVSYEPDDLSQSIPQPPTVKQDMTSQYYFCNSYSHWVNLLNKCLKNCFQGLVSAAGSDSLPSSNVPFLLFDTSTSELIFNFDVAGFEKSLENPIEVYLNTAMANLLSSFPSINMGYSQPNGMNNLIVIQNIYDTNTFVLPTYTAIQVLEEYSSISLWSSIQSIIFETATLPIQETITTEPISFNSGSSFLNNTQNTFMRILQDFTVPLEKASDWFPSVDYSASGSFVKYVDMSGHGNIKNLQISVSWMDIYNNVYPLYLPTGCKGFLNLCFKRKDSIN